jgi:hypothetical protein
MFLPRAAWLERLQEQVRRDIEQQSRDRDDDRDHDGGRERSR